MKAHELKAAGFTPNVICAHPGWGEPLFLKDVWPNARLVSYFEFYYHASGADVGFDPEFPDNDFAMAATIRIKNANNLLALEAADQGITPTHWQREQFPAAWRERIHVIHDGIDTDAIRPNAATVLRGNEGQLTLDGSMQILTFVNRHLEPCRGLHTFLRALPEIQRRCPDAHVVIVGSEDGAYGPPPPQGTTWKGLFLGEVADRLDPSHIHFLGKVPYQTFLAILQISTAHVYLTYPFVLSWSMLEAMSTECLVIGSNTPPVREVIQNERNGLLVDFFDAAALARMAADALNHREKYMQLRQAARQTIKEHYDLKTVCLPRHIALVEGA